MKRAHCRDFPGGPVVKTPHCQCRGCRFNPWSGVYDPTCHAAQPKDKKNKTRTHYIHEGTWIITNFSFDIMDTRRQWNSIFKVWEENNCLLASIIAFEKCPVIFICSFVGKLYFSLAVLGSFSYFCFFFSYLWFYNDVSWHGFLFI